MKYLLLFLLSTCMLQAQDFSLSSAYHLNRNLRSSGRLFRRTR